MLKFYYRSLQLSLIYHSKVLSGASTTSDSGLSNVFVIALNIYRLCSACMSQSPSSAITTFTRRRARDKLDSAATCDGHCKNKSTLTDTSANFTDQPHPLSCLVRLAFSQQPLLRFKPHNVYLKQLRHISRLNFRHCHTNSPHQITNHRQILHNLS